MPAETSLASSEPHVVVLLTTQWRANAFGFAGDPNARTPALDALAAESVWLREAVTPHPFGVFARAAFLTGRPSPENGLRDYYDPLPAGARTLAHAFREYGYRTAFFGKWQLHERDPAAPVVGEAHARVIVPPERRGGFDVWEGFESGFLLNDPLLHGTELPEPTRFAGYQSDVVLNRFARFFEATATGSEPLFALVSIDPPHPPYGPPAAGCEPLPEASIRLLEGTGPEPAVRATARRELAGYYAHIAATDRAVGNAVDRLRNAGLWDRTLFAFASVHGDMHGVEGKFRKGWPNEESIRVPLLLRWPGRLAPRADDGLYSLIDLGSTLLGLVGGAAADFPGRDWSAALRNGEPGPERQFISMPSVVPFAQQCPYAWTAERDVFATHVWPDSAPHYVLDHAAPRRFEG